MTEPQAKTWCKNFMGKSAAYKACQTIPKMNSESAVDVCVLDIMVSKTFDLCTIQTDSHAHGDTYINIVGQFRFAVYIFLYQF